MNEIFCPIHQDWYEFVGSKIIPPDVQTHVSACGHNLPIGAEMRERPEPEITVNLETDDNLKPQRKQKTFKEVLGV